VSGQSYADTFSYDLVGNRLTKTHDTSGNNESISYTYNNDDQLLTETGTLNGSPEYATTYAYDADGSLTSKTRTGSSPETDTYAYNLQNELVGSTVNGTTTTYATDAAGDQVSQTTGSTTTYSLVDDNNLTGYSQVLEQSTAGTLTTSYVIGDRVLGQSATGTPTYLVADGQGSTRLVTDATGVVTDRYSYDAFGNPLGFSASGAATTILYTAQQFDAGLGLYHLRARDYDPETGTFISFDSAMNGNADPLDLHKYLYAEADPVNKLDPGGHDDNEAEQLTTLGIVQNTLVRLVSSTAGQAFAAGGVVLGRYLNNIGAIAEQLAEDTLQLFPRLDVDQDVEVEGGRVVDFVVSLGERAAYIEAKYRIAETRGAALTRLIGQLNGALGEGDGKVILWSLREPTTTAINLLRQTLGDSFDEVELVNGVTGLYTAVKSYFRF
jgi:RHS repeat-associated protein